MLSGGGFAAWRRGNAQKGIVLTGTVAQVDSDESFFSFPVDGAIAQVFVFSYLSCVHEEGWGDDCGLRVVTWVQGAGSTTTTTRAGDVGVGETPPATPFPVATGAAVSDRDAGSSGSYSAAAPHPPSGQSGGCSKLLLGRGHGSALAARHPSCVHRSCPPCPASPPS